MKTAILNILLFFICFNVFSQCLDNRKAFESYFENNKSSLNQIEGIWSVSLYEESYYNGKLEDSSQESQYDEWVIIKDQGNTFKVCRIDNPLPTEFVIEFTATTNSDIYLYKELYFNEKNTANAVLNNNGLLNFKFEHSKETMKNTYKKLYKFGMHDFSEYSLIKTFPTSEKMIKKEKYSGTGFAISSNGVIVTNNHVIENAKSIKVKGINSEFNKIFNAKVLVSDKINDLAIIQISDSDFTSIETIPYILKTTLTNVGEDIFALGYPLRAVMGDEIKLTNGIISSKTGFKGDITSYQVSAPVQPGNSGGPLFDINGNVIGIINAKLTIAENASYAIKTSYLMNLIELLNIPIKLTTFNSLKGKSLSEQVQIINDFVYIIEIEL
jgi:S1-C subfamily serine protease